MKFKIIIIIFSCSIFVLGLETNQNLQKNILKFGYGTNLNLKDNYLIL